MTQVFVTLESIQVKFLFSKWWDNLPAILKSIKSFEIALRKEHFSGTAFAVRESTIWLGVRAFVLVCVFVRLVCVCGLFEETDSFGGFPPFFFPPRASLSFVRFGQLDLRHAHGCPFWMVMDSVVERRWERRGLERTRFFAA